MVAMSGAPKPLSYCTKDEASRWLRSLGEEPNAAWTTVEIKSRIKEILDARLGDAKLPNNLSKLRLSELRQECLNRGIKTQERDTRGVMMRKIREEVAREVSGRASRGESCERTTSCGRASRGESCERTSNGPESPCESSGPTSSVPAPRSESCGRTGETCGCTSCGESCRCQTAVKKMSEAIQKLCERVENLEVAVADGKSAGSWQELELPTK
jgi:hypothetical protein